MKSYQFYATVMVDSLFSSVLQLVMLQNYSKTYFIYKKHTMYYTIKIINCK